MRLQKHHIIYEDEGSGVKEWTVTLPWFMHRPMNILQKWKPTEERYALIENWELAIAHEKARIRRALDQAEE